VGTTFGFGLGARSFAFVEFGHLWDRRLQQHALPAQQASRIFNQTVASTSIAGSNNRVINNGLSPSRVVAATHMGIERVTVGGAKAATSAKSASAPRYAAPLILHGPDRSVRAAGGNGGTAAQEIIPRDALIVTGGKETTRAQTFNQASAPAARAWEVQRPSSTPRPAQAPAPVEWHSAAPSYQAPEIPRSAPAPTYTPPHTYSAPAVSYAPRAEAPESRPAYSAPPTPAVSAPAARSYSPPDRNGR